MGCGEQPGKKGVERFIKHPECPSIVPESDVDLVVPEKKKMKVLRCF